MTAMAMVFERLRARWRICRQAAADLSDLHSCDPGEEARIAADLGLTVPRLEALISRGTGGRQLMERMMAAFHLDCEAIERGAPGTLRDIEITCGCCSAKKRCSRELAAGSAARNAGRFCPNADILGALGRH